jgi:hypothetical protein
LRSPKTVSEALRSPEFREWIDAIHRELESLIQKGVFEISAVPTDRKIIPTKIVLKIKLKSDGTIDKMKARCCVLGFRQKSGLDYNPEQSASRFQPSTWPMLVHGSCSLRRAPERQSLVPDMA